MSTLIEVLDVSSPDGVEAVATALSPLSDVAVDVEADSMHHFRARLCFVQVGTGKDIFLLDTLHPEVRLGALAQAFGDETKTKFFHAAGGDLQYLAGAGVRVKGLFDTHRAATLLGRPKVGLADLVLEMHSVKLAKEHQQADFSKRPLPAELRAYIADDVRYLVDVGQRIREECRAADILEEVLLDCARMGDEAAQAPDVPREYAFKLQRQGLSGAQVALQEYVAAQLHARRLEWAEKEDVPMGMMLSNAAVVAIASHLPKSVKELSRLEGVRGRFTREHGDEVIALVRAAELLQTQGGLAPVAMERKADPSRRRREEALQAFRKGVAGERRVTPSVVLPNALVDDLARTNPRAKDELSRVPYLGEKRLSLYGQRILDTLARAG